MPSIKHTTVRVITELPDGSASIKTKSYNEDLSSIKSEVERRYPTSRNTLFADMLTCTEVLKESEQLTLIIEKRKGEPYLIRQIYTVNREYHGK